MPVIFHIDAKQDTSPSTIICSSCERHHMHKPDMSHGYTCDNPRSRKSVHSTRLSLVLAVDECSRSTVIHTIITEPSNWQHGVTSADSNNRQHRLSCACGPQKDRGMCGSSISFRPCNDSDNESILHRIRHGMHGIRDPFESAGLLAISSLARSSHNMNFRVGLTNVSYRTSRNVETITGLWAREREKCANRQPGVA